MSLSLSQIIRSLDKIKTASRSFVMHLTKKRIIGEGRPPRRPPTSRLEPQIVLLLTKSRILIDLKREDFAQK
jgi:hypothetical protein